MPRLPAPKIDPSTFAVHNWEQRAKQLFMIADVMSDPAAAAILREKAQGYLRHAQAGDLHGKQAPGAARGPQTARAPNSLE